MTASDQKPGFFRRLGQWVTRLRVIISNLLFFLLLAVVLIMLFSSVPTPEVPDGGALVVNPRGTIVERRTPIDPLQQWLAPQAVVPETVLTDLVDALDAAREDARIAMVVLDLHDLQFVSTVHASAVGDALRRFRDSGKQVVAYGSYYAQQPYLIAAHADAVYMHPLGQVEMSGYAIGQLYYADLLDRLDVNVHVFRAGRYKEFVEPYLRSDMSPEAREANQELIGALWQAYSAKVTANRDLDPNRFARYAGSYDEAVAETDGDFARLAVEYHLVDELLTPDQARVRVADTVGYNGDGSYRQIDFRQYLVAVNGVEAPANEPATIGVITGQGPITMRDALADGIAAEEMIELIRSVRDNEAIKALVVRLDTPGGSAFASELIRQELELVQLSGKPVVVSMGPVAASRRILDLGHRGRHRRRAHHAHRIHRSVRHPADVREQPETDRRQFRWRQHFGTGPGGSAPRLVRSRRQRAADRHRPHLPALHQPGGPGPRTDAGTGGKRGSGTGLDRQPGPGPGPGRQPGRPVGGSGKGR